MNRFLRWFEERYPDPYVLALGLSLLAILAAWAGTPWGFVDLARFWGKGFSRIFTFTTQMALILVTGYALALSPPVDRLLHRLARLPRTPVQAVWLVGLASGVASWIQWGLGLVVGGILALRVHREQRISLPLLAASGYTGFLVWHSGLSGSIPLTIATPGLPQNELERVFGFVASTRTTLLTWWNLVPAVLVLVLSLWALSRWAQTLPVEEERPSQVVPDSVVPPPSRDRVGTWLQGLLVVFGALYLVQHWRHGGGLNLNVVILLFLLLGMALHGTASRYARAVATATPAVAGILLQFPLYGGIQGVLIQSGLGTKIAGWIAGSAPVQLFYLLQFYTAGLINLFVPSGGGQWVVQGPVAMEAARLIGADPVVTAMVIAWGDAWTNMIQPFWALPLLGMVRLPARRIMAYTLISLLVAGGIWTLWCGMLGWWMRG